MLSAVDGDCKSRLLQHVVVLYFGFHSRGRSNCKDNSLIYMPEKPPVQDLSTALFSACMSSTKGFPSSHVEAHD